MSPFFRFQNRRTKWKKTENISNTEAAEYKLGTRKMSSSSSSSLDHHQKTDSMCSSTSSHTIPLNYFHPLKHFIPSNQCSSSISSPIHEGETFKDSRSSSR